MYLAERSQRLTSGEAYDFLKKTEEIEETGILCRIPNWWKRKAASVSMSLNLGEERPAMLGFDTLVSMRPKLMVDGQQLTEEDVRNLLARTEGLAFLKGRWVEVDHEKLKKLLKEMDGRRGELTLMEALRLELGTAEDEEASGPVITNGERTVRRTVKRKKAGTASACIRYGRISKCGRRPEIFPDPEYREAGCGFKMRGIWKNEEDNQNFMLWRFQYLRLYSGKRRQI